MTLILRLFIAWLCCLLTPCSRLLAQTALSWDQLAEVTVENKHDEAAKAYYSQIIPSPAIQQLNEQEITIKGYMLPMDVKDGYYILSAFPNSSCFFCGGAGEESVIELTFKMPPRTYKMDEVVTLKGKFQWRNEAFVLPYALLEAKEVD